MGQAIYKILTTDQLRVVERGGRMEAPVDLEDGYVHFSTSRQVQDTLSKWFRGRKDCMLVAVDGDDFGPDLKWEVSRGGDHFPHVYAAVLQRHIRAIWQLDTHDNNGAPLAPAEVTIQPEPSTKPERKP